MTGDLLKDTQGKVELSPKSRKIDAHLHQRFLKTPRTQAIRGKTDKS